MNAFKCIWRTLSITMRTLRLVFLPAIFIPVCDSPNLRNIINLRYADDTTLMTENEEELKSLLMRVKEESEKAGLKLNIQEMKIMAYGPITSWQVEGEKLETVTDFIFLGSKVTADGDYSHEIKRHLLLGRKVMTNLDSILKSRYITLLTKVHLVKTMDFPVVMYGCEKVKVTQSCQTLCNPMDYTVLGIFQARILEWIAFPFSKGSFQPRD